MTKTEKEKMLSGEVYRYEDVELAEERKRARELMKRYNAMDDEDNALSALQDLLGHVGDGTSIQRPFRCDYGKYISIGDNCYINFGCVILDCNTVEIGNNVLIGPYSQIYTAHHPIDAKTRLLKTSIATPIKIGNCVWIGGGSIICPGVEIGDNTIIGAGSVVVKSLPANVIAVGNPCNVLKTIENE